MAPMSSFTPPPPARAPYKGGVNRGLTAALLLALLACGAVRGEDGAARAAQAGELVVLKNHSVLRLFGESARERGFAQGWLLAPKIIECLDDALSSLPRFNAQSYEKRLLPWAKARFVWDKAAEEELDGIWQGFAAKLKEDERTCPALKRALTKDDLYAINTVADYFGPACSGFTAWKSKTANGEVLHGRNLDFPIGRRAIADQVIVVNEAFGEEAGARRAWAGVGWPGMVGVYSAMNADGLVCCLHDAYNVDESGADDGYVPRGVLLRRIIESVDPSAGDPAQAAAKLAADRPAACGNLFHLSWPSKAAEKTRTQPSAVLEFERNGRGNGEVPVTIRRMDGSDAIVATNHFCMRHAPVECGRFDAISKGIDSLSAKPEKIGPTEARKILIGGMQPTAAHSLVFRPDAREIHVSLTRGNIMSPQVAGSAFTLKELFERSK